MSVRWRTRFEEAPARAGRHGWGKVVLIGFCFLSLVRALDASEVCLTGSDMDAATRSALETSARRFFDMAAKGDTESLKQNSIASLASNFGGVENAVRDNQPNLAGAQATPRPPFLLKEDGNAPAERAEFNCGVFGASGQTSNSAIFVIPGLAPGNYALVVLDLIGGKAASTLSFVLEQEGTAWKLGGFYAKPKELNGHDGQWFLAQARDYKAKGQTRNAWFYYLQAHELLTPVDFMSTLSTDRLYGEAQSVRPSDLPTGGTGPVDLPVNGKNDKLTNIFPLVVGSDLNLVVKYQYPDVSNTGQAFQENAAVIRALVAKYPEFRSAFAGIVARAVEPSGRDYGTLLLMKDIK